MINDRHTAQGRGWLTAYSQLSGLRALRDAVRHGFVRGLVLTRANS